MTPTAPHAAPRTGASRPGRRSDPTQAHPHHHPHTHAQAAARALGRVLAMTGRWGLSPDDECLLLSADDSQALLDWRHARVMPPGEALTRITLLSALARLLDGPAGAAAVADPDWIVTPRPEAPFHGRTPLDCMLRGGAAAMAQVRRCLEAEWGAPLVDTARPAARTEASA